MDLLKNSNQIIHNRGRALAYLGNAEKKRKYHGGAGDNLAGSDDEGAYVKVPRVKHQYELKANIVNYAPSPFSQLMSQLAMASRIGGSASTTNNSNLETNPSSMMGLDSNN
jgi:hypothetical protein